MDNMELARLPESGRLDMKKLGEMWKTVTEPQREVSPMLYVHGAIPRSGPMMKCEVVILHNT